jgi:hypothetical protein
MWPADPRQRQCGSLPVRSRLLFSSPGRNRAIDSKPPRPCLRNGKPDLAHRLARAGNADLEWFGTWNDWSVALLGCVVFDVFSGREVSSRAR